MIETLLWLKLYKKISISRMAALKRYRQEIRLLLKKDVSDRRRDLLKDLNISFFPLKLWPRDMQAVISGIGVLLLTPSVHFL